MITDERDAEVALMRGTIGAAAYDSLARLNNLYGYGEPIRIAFDQTCGSGTVVVRRHMMTDSILNFRLQHGTMYYCGHQSKVKLS